LQIQIEHLRPTIIHVYIISKVAKRTTYGRNKEESSSTYKNYSHFKTKKPFDVLGFKDYNNPP